MKIHPQDCVNFGVAFTNRPLKDGQMFQLQLESVDRNRWHEPWKFGVTTVRPVEFQFTESVLDSKQGSLWVVSRSKVYRNNNCVCELNVDIDAVEAGCTVGVQKNGATLTFYVNDCDMLCK